MQRSIEIPCHHEDEDGVQCDAPAEVILDWEAGEMYGQDADGNRGIWLPPAWAVAEVCTCTAGHEPGDQAELRALDAAGDPVEGPDEGDWWDSMGGNDD